MKNEAPILIIGHSRPEKLKNLLTSLRSLRPSKILFAIDGPREHVNGESVRVFECQKLVDEINWPASIETLFRKSNLGIRYAIPDAVSWAVSKYGKVIVLEDDVFVGPQFLDFANKMLDIYKKDNNLSHVNGYNLAPPGTISNSSVSHRFSRYTSSYAWATWETSWSEYDDSMEWAKNLSFRELREICGSYSGAIVWRAHFNDALKENVDTWAYRWLASIWSKNKKCISPNSNLIVYDGFEEGTHTRRRVRWDPLPITELSFSQSNRLEIKENIDIVADQWLGKNVFQETLVGAVDAVLASRALTLLKFLKKYKTK